MAKLKICNVLAISLIVMISSAVLVLNLQIPDRPISEQDVGSLVKNFTSTMGGLIILLAGITMFYVGRDRKFMEGGIVLAGILLLLVNGVPNLIEISSGELPDPGVVLMKKYASITLSIVTLLLALIKFVV